MTENQHAVDSQLYTDWEQERLGKFTSSGIGVLYTEVKELTDGGLTYVHKKVAETITQTANEASSAAIEWGNTCEPMAAQRFGDLIGSHFEYYGKANPLFFPYGEDAGGSPDGILTDLDAVVEIKCPFESCNHSEVVHGIKTGTFNLKKFNKNYYAQCQFNMLVTDRQQSYFVSFDPRWMIDADQLVYAIIPRDEKYLSLLLTKLELAINLKYEILKTIGFYANNS